MPRRAVQEALARVDWNFLSAAKHPTVHSLHWFPGNFIPQIPSFLIQLLSTANSLVVDPFCGSGTTGIEAISLGREAWLGDTSRPAVQVAVGKIAAMQHTAAISADARTIIDQLVWDELLRSDSPGRLGEGSDARLADWYHVDTLAQLRFIWHLVETSVRTATRQFLEMIFSDTLFACAASRGARTGSGGRRRHHWGWVADNVLPIKPVEANAIEEFRRRLSRAVDVLASVRPGVSRSAAVCRADARDVPLAPGQADLIVTSPPPVPPVS